jgi:hypothetical protein
MNKKSLTIISLVVFLGLSVVVYQYIKQLQSEFASAAYSTTKPANGHSWAEMECTSGLCVTADNKVGIGTDTPLKKLEVNGDILASGTGDVCNGGGKCLSSIFQTNIIVGTNPVCPTGQIGIQKAYNGTWYTTDNSAITSWTKIICGQALSGDGSSLLYTSTHTSLMCTTAGGTVVDDGAGHFICRFNGSSCLTNWTAYGNWRTYAASHCVGTGGGVYGCEAIACWTAAAPWGNNAIPTCLYGMIPYSGEPYCLTCYGAVTQIGCY